MQLNGPSEEQNDLFESDSLFGSPPSSPGRVGSPGLALPGVSSFTDNVGTIALPGPHAYSELSVNPPDSFLSVDNHVRRQPQVLRPPSLPPAHAVAAPCPPQQSLPASSRSSYTPVPTTRQKKKKDKDKSRTATPRPTPPPIHMPDPSAPPPANFLRNQQALLGLAGLVAGVNPANVHRRAGSSAKNPIVVEEGRDAPTLARRSQLPHIDPSQLPPPSGEAIVESLIKQKNIFPVLNSILRLIDIAGSSAPSTQVHQYSQYPPPSSRENGGPPPAKRKKLAKVPAGAANWDVPFPFSNGEGPQAYNASWERERSRQLIAQLVSLLRSAASKAATKAYVEKLKEQEKASAPPEPPNVLGYYRPVTVLYGTGLEGLDIPIGLENMLTDVSNGNDVVRPSSENDPSPGSNDSQQTPSFEQLIASLLAAAPPQTDCTYDNTSAPVAPLDTGASAEDKTQDVENWMWMLESVPPFESDAQNQNDDIFAALNVLDSGSLPDASTSAANTMDMAAAEAPQPVPDFAIDPILLALSTSHLPKPTENPSNSEASPITPGLVHSPITSTSSLADPLTPSNWDSMFPEVDIASGDQGHDPFGATAMLQQLASTSMSQSFQCSPPAENVPCFVSPAVTTEQPLPPFTGSAIPLGPSTLSMFDQFKDTSVPSASGSTSSVIPPLSRPAGPGRPVGSGSKKINKEDILRRANDRRRQLFAEIERAKVQLWESTLEQGVLTHLIKDSG